MLKGGVLVILRRLLVMNKTILKFVFAESSIILGFQLFTGYERKALCFSHRDISS